MIQRTLARLVPVICAGCVLIPTAASAGSIAERAYPPGYARDYAPYYWPYAAPSYYPTTRAPKQNLHLYLAPRGDTVRVLDGGNQIVSYDRGCRIHEEIVPSPRGPHRVTVTRC